MRKLLLLAFLSLSPYFAIPAIAQSNVLYGLTSDGKLITINTSTLVASQVRTTLASTFLPITSLAFIDNSFLTTYGPGTGAGDKLVAFGPTAGDERYRGITNTGTWAYYPQALTTAPDGYLKGVSQRSDPSNNPVFYVVQVDQSDGDTVYLPNPFTRAIGYHSGDWPITGIALTDSNTAYLITSYQFPVNNTFGLEAEFWKLSRSGGNWSATYKIFPSMGSVPHGLVVDPNNSNILYTVVSFGTTTELYRISLTSSPPTFTDVGLVGFSGAVQGLVYGPSLGSISSPNPPTPPPPPPNCGTACVWEAVRSSLEDD